MNLYGIIPTKKLRKSHNYKKQPCSVCGRHKNISELHHLISLAEAAEIISMADRYGIEMSLNLPEIWLCPNHHAYYHVLQSKMEKAINLAIDIMCEDISYKELTIFVDSLHEKLKWFEDLEKEITDCYVKDQIPNSDTYRVLCFIVNKQYLAVHRNIQLSNRVIESPLFTRKVGENECL